MTEINEPKPTVPGFPTPSTRASYASRVWGNVCFGLAGLLFPVICFISGVVAGTAAGVDYETTQAYQTYTYTSVAAVFFPSLLVAVAGLIFWIVQLVRRGNTLVPGLILLVLQGLAFALLAFVFPHFAPLDQCNPFLDPATNCTTRLPA